MNFENFQCRRCGACCSIKDGIVRLGSGDVAAIAAFLGMSEEDFIERETELSPDRKGLVLKSHPDGRCAYLDENNLCLINDVKPAKCKSFPFEWVNEDSAQICPGIARCADSKIKEHHR